MPAAFESQGCAEYSFLRNFKQLVINRADQIGALVAALTIYLSRHLSMTLQRNVTQTITINLLTLYKDQVGPVAIEETA